MKVRWTSDSLRFRITPAELAAVAAGGVASETMRVSDPVWQATLGTAATITSLQCGPGRVEVQLSAEDLKRLLAEDCEGLYLQDDSVPAMRYSVEKDFPCVHPRPAAALEPATQHFTPPPDFEARKAG